MRRSWLSSIGERPPGTWPSVLAKKAVAEPGASEERAGTRVLWNAEPIEAPRGGNYSATQLAFGGFNFPPASGWEIQILDENSLIIARFSHEEIGTKTTLTTPWMFRTGSLQIRVFGTGQPYTVPPLQLIGKWQEKDTPLQVYGQVPVFSPLSSLDEPGFPGRWVSESVVLLRISNGTLCTGVAYRSDAILTAVHCFDGVDKKCSKIQQMKFDYDQVPRPGISARCEEVVSVGGADAAVVKITNGIPKTNGGLARRPLELRATPLDVRERAVLIHHPAGLPKIVSSCCEVWGNINGPKLNHSCGALVGSSGGALVDLQGRLVAIHTGSERDEHMSDLYLAIQMARGKIYSNYAVGAGFIANQH